TIDPLRVAAETAMGGSISSALGSAGVELQNPCVRRALADERGSIQQGPPAMQAPQQVPDATAVTLLGYVTSPRQPPGASRVANPRPRDQTPDPARLADFRERHIRNMQRAGQSIEDATESADELMSVYGHGPDVQVTHAQMIQDANEALPALLAGGKP